MTVYPPKIEQEEERVLLMSVGVLSVLGLDPVEGLVKLHHHSPI